jgi:signal transduction histidine kinase
MGPVRRVIIHDRYPVLDADIVRRPLNLAVLLAAAAAIALQLVAIAQEAWGPSGSAGALGPAPCAAVAFLWLALGLLVFLQRRARYAGQFFLLAAAAGSVFLSFAATSRTLLESCLFAAGLLLFPAFLLAFARGFDEARPWRRRDLLLYVAPLALIWPVGEALYRSDVSGPVWRAGLSVVGLYLLAAIGQVGWDAVAARSAPRAGQLRALLVGLVVGTLISIPVFLVPIVVSGRKVDVTLLPFVVLLFLAAVGYSVLLRELNEVDFFVRRGIVYAVMTVGVLAAYVVLGVVLAARQATVASIAGSIGLVALAVAAGAGFTPIRRGARRLVDGWVYGERVDRWDLLQALSDHLGVVMAPGALGDTLVREIGEALHASSAFLLMRGEDGELVASHVMSGDQHGRKVLGTRVSAVGLEKALGVPAAPLLLIHARPLVASRRESVPDRYTPLHRMRVSLAVPLETRSGLTAVLCLRPKRTHEGYNRGDLDLLAPVVRQAAAALENALLFARLEDNVQELRSAYRRIAGEQETERARLAAELHDGIAQELANLITLATVAERQMNGDNAAAGATLDRLRGQAEAAYGEVRRVSHGLRPVLLDDYGLAPALRRFAETFAAASGIELDVDLPDVEGLTPEAELALFRVAQECLENTRKHSQARRAGISLSSKNGSVLLHVSDEGRGLAAGSGQGLGLAGMRERMRAVGGSVRMESSKGCGAVVEAVVPLEDV